MDYRGEFTIRLDNIDTYQHHPTLLDPQLPRLPSFKYDPGVPIIRIYGTNGHGEQVCAHIHGALPYLYIEYPAPYDNLEFDGGLDPFVLRMTTENLRQSVEAALDSSIQRRFKKDSKEQSKHQFVATILPVKGIPFYGYHVGYRIFFKIYLFNPRHVRRLAELLEKGAVLNRPLQPYETHLGFVHQFMIDYNLYGCNYIRVPSRKVWYRKIHEDYDTDDIDDSPKKIHNIPENQMLESDQFPSQIYAGWEVDLCVKDILNTKSVSQRFLHHEFTDPDAPSDPGAKLLKSLEELWLEHGSLVDIDETQSFSSSSGPERGRPVWLSESVYRSELDRLKSYEDRKHGKIKPETIPFRAPGIKSLYSAYESVDFLNNFYPPETKIPHYRGSAFRKAVQRNPVEQQLIDNYDDSMFDFYDDEIGEDDADNETDYDDPWANDEIMEEDKEESDELSKAELGVVEEVEWEIPKVSIGSRSPDPTMGDIEDVAKSLGLEADDGDDDGLLALTPGSPIARTPKVGKGRTNKRKRNDTSPPPRPQIRHRVGSSNHVFGVDMEPLTKKQYSSYRPPPLETDPIFTSMQLLGDEGRIEQHELPDFPSSAPETVSTQIVRQEILQSLLGPDSSQVSAEFEDFVDGIYDAFELHHRRKIMIFAQVPPTSFEAHDALLKSHGAFYQKAFYGNPEDAPKHPVEIGGDFHRLEVKDLAHYPVFDPLHEGRKDLNMSGESSGGLWMLARPPPSYQEVVDSAKSQNIWGVTPKETAKKVWDYRPPKSKEKFSQILGPTQKTRNGFRETQRPPKSTIVNKTAGNMSIMSLEVHVNTRKHLVPDPKHDAIECIFWAVQLSPEDPPLTGIIMVGDDDDRNRIRGFRKEDLRVEQTETDLIMALIDIVRAQDPDILAGYEVHSYSWGYVIERAKHAIDIQLTDDLSRVKIYSRGRFGKDADKWGYKKSASIKVVGREMLNIWRAMKGGIALNSYRLENVAFHQLNRRIPHYSFRDLTNWYKSKNALNKEKVLRYHLMRTKLNLELLEKEDFITRISEQARIIGITFNQVLSRGSQLKVESLLFRIAKPESFILVSPSRKQVSDQNAIECKPLIMEPRSKFYTDPVVVLDFQSLYPSIMIAHNYCYSTCLGRIQDGWSGKNKLGFKKHYARSPGLLKYAEDYLNISPNGLVFVNEKFRQSLLSKMLQEILDTRVMVKKRMKDPKIDRWTKKKLNGRQLALKLIANVTYGYTSATYSGRMPCVEIADSIVQTGRETLEKAIALIKRETAWGAEVVYGDTDSIFVHLPGKTRDQAFNIGEQIAARVTAMNPAPVKLQFEKVYHPSILLAMKRYVGYKYEYRSQAEPDFDAKGIEVIRRDGTPALQKLERKCIDILFRTKDVSKVKAHCQSEWVRIMKDRVSIQDFCIAKEVKLGKYKEGAQPQAGVVIAAKRMAKDPRNEPQYGERVPYVVVAGKSKRISDRAMEVEEMLRSGHILDSAYYIGRTMINPLNRIFSIVGSNVQDWWNNTPKYQPLREVTRFGQKEVEYRVETLELLLAPSAEVCPLCEKEKEVDDQICKDCWTNKDRSFYEVRRRMMDVERRVSNLNAVCRSCAGLSVVEEISCDSIDCPVFYSRIRETTKLRNFRVSERQMIQILENGEEMSECGDVIPM